MSTTRPNLTPLLLLFGLAAFGFAGLSIADMLLPRPYDGVVLDKEASRELEVLEVIPGSGADRAGIEPGDLILGIGREALRDEAHAARRLARYRIGERVIYLVKDADTARLRDAEVELGRRQIGDGPYFYACALGLAFFFVGLFVLVRQPGLLASQAFFFMACLFLLFLVCRLRPPSYSGIDSWILGIGTLAFLLLPPAFLHFYVLFPRPTWLESAAEDGRLRPVVWLFRQGWPALYLVPPIVYLASWRATGAYRETRWFAGAPVLNWWILGVSVLLGLLALRANAARLKSARERRGVTLVLIGSLFGLLPFAVASLFLPVYGESRVFLLAGLLPLALVPITFTYAIVRFGLLDIRVILRRSLLYTVTTVLVSSFYAAGIAMFNAFFEGSPLARSGYFPIVLALAIVILFDPVRRRVQRLIDRAFFADRSRLLDAMSDLGEAMTARQDLQTVVGDLVERLPQILGFRFAALYLERGGSLERLAGPVGLPERLPLLGELMRYLGKRRGPVRLDQMGSLPLRSPAVAEWAERLVALDVEAVADLASKRRTLGLVLFSDRPGQPPLEEEESKLLERLLAQAAVALETGLLLEERTQQAELEREMEIAAAIQSQLLPRSVHLGDGWRVAAQCRPARLVGGDFFAELVTPSGRGAVVWGDVSGKSVSGAMMMMAAHEALHTLSMALDDPPPERLFELVNRRVYGLGRRNFVALGYLAAARDGETLTYLVAGQPPPLVRRLDGRVEELPLAPHRIPVGALAQATYERRETNLEPGEVLLAYSDGVTDARSPDGEFFGEERLRAVIESRKNDDPEDLVAAIAEAIETFGAGQPLYDDVTLVAVAREASPDGFSGAAGPGKASA